MALYLIGIGLSDEKDISLRGKEIARRCDKVYLDYYTSRIGCPPERIEKVIGRKIHLAGRDLIEKEAEGTLLEEAKVKDVALLVVGDPMAATTHRDLLLRAYHADVNVGIVNNASVFTAVGNTGLDLYKFGRTASIAFPEKNYHPTTAYDTIVQNKKQELHTLCLLDIKADERPPRFMTVNEAIVILLGIEKKKKKRALTPSTLVVGCARLGASNYTIKAGLTKDVQYIDFGDPPHCLIVPGKLHFLEEEMLELWKTDVLSLT